MTLFIGSGAVTQKDFSNPVSLITKVLALPAIAIKKRDDSMSTKGLQLVLEREILVTNKHELRRRKITHLGTQGVVDCIVAYISTDEDRILIHVDNAYDFTPLHFDHLFKKLLSKKNIKVRLAGGIDAAISREHVMVMLEQLFAASKANQCDIHVEQQCLWPHNQPTEHDKNQHLVDRILRKIKMAYQQEFSESFPMDSSFMASSLDFNDDLPDGIDLTQVRLFCGLVYSARLLMDSGWLQRMATVDAMLFDQCKDKKKRFIELAHASFSKQGGSVIRLLYSKSMTGVRLKDFAFSVGSGNIRQIDPAIASPFLHYRRVRRLDLFVTPEFLLIDKEINGLSILSLKFLNLCREFKATVDKGVVDNRDEFELRISQQIFSSNTVSLRIFDLLYEFIVSEDYALAMRMHDSKNVVKQSYSKARSLFLENKYNESLVILRSVLMALIAKYGESSSECATCYSTMASCYRELACYEKAIDSIQRAVEVYDALGDDKMSSKERIVGKYHAILSVSKADLKQCHQDAVGFYKQKRYVLAKQTLVYIAKSFLKQDQKKEAATSYSVLASCCRELGDRLGARDYAEKSYELCKEVFGDNSSRVKKAFQKYKGFCSGEKIALLN